MSYMADCLREVDATELVNAEWNGIVYGICGMPFTPVLDGIFFPESPAKAMARGNYKKTEILLGPNTNEGHYFIIYYLTELFKKQARNGLILLMNEPADGREEKGEFESFSPGWIRKPSASGSATWRRKL